MRTFRRAWVVLAAYGVFGLVTSVVVYMVERRTIETKFLAGPEIIFVLGLSYLSTNVLFTAIAVKAFRRQEIWAWYALWVGPFFVGADAAFNLSIGGSAWPIDLVSFVLLSVVLLISPQFAVIAGKGRKVELAVGRPPGEA